MNESDRQFSASDSLVHSCFFLFCGRFFFNHRARRTRMNKMNESLKEPATDCLKLVFQRTLLI